MDDVVRDGADATTRAELDSLRRRAYGPEASTLDAATIARLQELEALHREASPQPGLDAGVDPDTAPSAAASTQSARARRPDADDSPEPDSSTRPRANQRTLRTAGFAGLAVAIVASVASLAPALAPDARDDALSSQMTGSATASPVDIASTARFVFTADPYTESLLRVRLDGSFGDYVDMPTAGTVPDFPADGELSWVSPLGDYYGWDLWIAGGGDAADPEHCILITRDGDTRARCTALSYQRLGVLRVSLASDDIAPEEQPVVMRDDQHVRFWWRDDGVVDIVLGSFVAR